MTSSRDTFRYREGPDGKKFVANSFCDKELGQVVTAVFMFSVMLVSVGSAVTVKQLMNNLGKTKSYCI